MTKRELDNDQINTWAMLLHLSGFLVFMIPGLHVLVAVVIWQVFRASAGHIDNHGREVVNFLISFFLWALLCVPFFYWLGFGVIMLLILKILFVIFVINGAIAAKNGRPYKYPMTLNLV